MTSFWLGMMMWLKEEERERLKERKSKMKKTGADGKKRKRAWRRGSFKEVHCIEYFRGLVRVDDDVQEESQGNTDGEWTHQGRRGGGLEVSRSLSLSLASSSAYLALPHSVCLPAPAPWPGKSAHLHANTGRHQHTNVKQTSSP